MFGMSLPEIIVIAVIAVLFLGPDKLPSAMVEIAKFFKTVKKTVNDAKSSFDQEIKIQELKEDAKKYKESIAKTTETVRKKLTFEELDELKKGVNDVTSGITDGAKTTETVRKKLTFEELDELKKGVNDVTSGITDGLNDVKKSVEVVKNPGEAVKNAVLGDNEKKEA